MAVEANKSSLWAKLILLVNCVVLVIGISGGPLIIRLYFLHGGERIWLSSALQTAGFPLILITLLIAYFRRCSSTTNAKLVFMQSRIFMGSVVIGLLTGTILVPRSLARQSVLCSPRSFLCQSYFLWF